MDVVVDVDLNFYVVVDVHVHDHVNEKRDGSSPTLFEVFTCQSGRNHYIAVHKKLTNFSGETNQWPTKCHDPRILRM